MTDPLEEITNLIRAFHKKMEVLLPGLESEVDSLIASKTKDEQLIERNLDTLLDLAAAGVGEKLFIKLIEYAKTVNPKIAADYWRYYEES